MKWLESPRWIAISAMKTGNWEDRNRKILALLFQKDIDTASGIYYNQTN